MIRAVVFDLDDTLAPEYGYVLSGYRALSPYLSQVTGHSPEEVFDTLKALFDESTKNVFNRLFEGYGIEADGDEIMKLVAMYREHDPGPEYALYGDVETTLSFLRGKGLRLGILTDGFASSQKKKLKALGISAVMDYILVTGEMGDEYKKPGKEGFLLMSEKLGVDPSQMLYVGDNPAKDFYIKRYLPVMTARIIRPRGVYNDTEYREDIKEDFGLNSLSELTGDTYAYLF